MVNKILFLIFCKQLFINISRCITAHILIRHKHAVKITATATEFHFNQVVQLWNLLQSLSALRLAFIFLLIKKENVNILKVYYECLT